MKTFFPEVDVFPAACLFCGKIIPRENSVILENGKEKFLCDRCYKNFKKIFCPKVKKEERQED